MTPEEIKAKFKEFWEGLNRNGRRGFIKNYNRGVMHKRHLTGK